jgi:PAS domain S-box-containing protein
MTDISRIDYKKLFTDLPACYVVFDCDAPHFTMLTASAGYFEVTGKTYEEIVGHGLFKVFPDISERASKTGKGELQVSLEKVIRTKQPDSTGVIRYDIADENGAMERRYWQATHYPWLDDDGECKAIIQSTSDVTATIMSEERLRLTRHQLDNALSTGLVGSWAWDIVNDLVTCDEGLAKMFGIPAEQALSGLPIQLFIDSIYTDDKERVQTEIQSAMKSKKAFESEYRTIDRNGVIRWVIARGSVEYDETGDARSFPGVMIDITSRKKAENDLADSEQRLRFMTDTMPHLVWITRPDGFHEYYNKQWYEYTGTNEGETDGEGWRDLFHKDDQTKANRAWLHSLKSGEPYEIQYRLYHAPSNSYRWVIGRAMPYRNESGEITKWYGTCTDINDSLDELEKRRALEVALKEEKTNLEARVMERTSQLKATNKGLRDEILKRKQIERKIRTYGEELKRSNKELEDFAYVSSHDLQEPLRKIQAFGDILREEYAEKLGDGEEYLERMQRAASRMSTLIEDLLKFSRVTTVKAETKNIDLNITLKDVVSDLGERITRENGKVNVNVSELPTVRADETHMRQLFQNLIANALKFHKKDQAPIVIVSAESNDKENIIRVADNGIGIDEKYVAKIFYVFQRLNSTQAYEGTGIGLAVCKKIVERYGGTIAVESQPGQGTTFIITLPIINEE